MRQAEEKTGLIFNIQHFSVHDGPGIRTVVFLKGCPLRCRWCCNPESQAPYPELALNARKCIGAPQCLRCVRTCPGGAITWQDEKGIVINRQACSRCFACSTGCPSKSLHVFGRTASVQEVLSAVETDSAFHSRSGGGLTLGGGEPLMQAEFAIQLLQEARRRSIHTAIETCGFVPWARLEESAAFLRTVLFDLKHMDPDKHKAYTGVSNETILTNLVNLRRSFPQLDILVRTPVIPGFNDSEEELGAIAGFIKALPGGGPAIGHQLLPYHRMGAPKYSFLGRGAYLPSRIRNGLLEGKHVQVGGSSLERCASGSVEGP